MGINDGLFSSDHNDWETPQEFFDMLDVEFRFQLDVCATPQTAKCKQFYTVEDNGLIKCWSGRCWMNPPYGREIKAWVRKAYSTTLAGTPVVVCLLPARTDTAWWHDYVMKAAEIRLIRGRLKFQRNGKGGSAPFPSVVVIFKGGDHIPAFSAIPPVDRSRPKLVVIPVSPKGV